MQLLTLKSTTHLLKLLIYQSFYLLLIYQIMVKISGQGRHGRVQEAREVVRPRADQGGREQQHGPRRHQDDQSRLDNVSATQGLSLNLTFS